MQMRNPHPDQADCTADLFSAPAVPHKNEAGFAAGLFGIVPLEGT